MAVTSRGKKAIGAAVAVAVVGAAALALTGNAPTAIQKAAGAIGIAPPPPTCPLTGELTPGGEEAPRRSLLAVKVENTDAAYPLRGLDRADMVYEEVVEGGITRFVAIYHCRDANDVGPVRSARTTDPKILAPLQQQPVLAFAGAAPSVVKALVDDGIVQLTEANTPAAFSRDDARIAPHNLFTSTAALWRAAAKQVDEPATPRAAFTFGDELPQRSKKATSIDITFSSLSSTGWTWEGGRWTRLLAGSPMSLENGQQVRAENVVVQIVKVTEDTIVDASGAFSPLVEMTGRGKAWVFRDGRAIAATWERSGEGDQTTFRTKDGDEIELSPGATWVELVPTDGSVTFSK
ncbi:MAG TPA: DUF3048 domain-containing protein [Actinomycetota bacterium]|nr:DUF3048 domain-containing protein [Actinomycetota bacterium]